MSDRGPSFTNPNLEDSLMRWGSPWWCWEEIWTFPRIFLRPLRSWLGFQRIINIRGFEKNKKILKVCSVHIGIWGRIPNFSLLFFFHFIEWKSISKNSANGKLLASLCPKDFNKDISFYGTRWQIWPPAPLCFPLWGTESNKTPCTTVFPTVRYREQTHRVLGPSQAILLLLLSSVVRGRWSLGSERDQPRKINK